MRLISLVDFISDITGKKSYPLEFPTNTTLENILVVDIINGSINGTVTEMNIQIMTKSSHPSVAEELANTVIETLHNVTNRAWAGYQIILIQAKNPNPFYNGQDANNEYIYTADFRLLVSDTN